MSERAAYLRDGAAIYERSFAIIRAETDLSRFSASAAGGRKCGTIASFRILQGLAQPGEPHLHGDLRRHLLRGGVL